MICHLSRYFAILCLIAYIPVQADQLVSRVAITVNGVPITDKEIEDRCSMARQYASHSEKISRAQVVNTLITEELLLQMAQKNGLDEEINQNIAAAIQAGEVSPDLAKDTQKLKKQFILHGLTRNLQDHLPVDLTEKEIEEQAKDLPESALNIPPIRYHVEVLQIPQPSLNYLNKIWPFFSVKQQSTTMSRETVIFPVLHAAQQGVSFKEIVKKQPSWKVFEKWYTTDKVPNFYDKTLLQSIKAGDVVGPFETKKATHLVRLKEIKGFYIVQARHILLKSKEDRTPQSMKQQLEHIRQNCLMKKCTFPEQVRQYSEDLETIFTEGDLGWIVPETAFPAMSKAFNSLASGEISQPFQGKQGFQIVQVVQKQFVTADNPIWKSIIAKNILTNQKQFQAFQKICKALYDDAHIEWVNTELKVLESEIRNSFTVT